MAQRRYSRLARVEKAKNTQTAIVFGFLTIGLLVLIFSFGLPAVAKLAGFIAGLGKSSQPIEINDTTPPAPPLLETVPDYTNQAELKIKGSTEEGVTVLLIFNGVEEETVADHQGSFEFTVRLIAGENTFYVKAIDEAQNESAESKRMTVVFDDQEPTLEISEPGDGQYFYGSGQKQVTFKGTTEVGVNLTINERVVIVESDGSFSFTTNLSEGENKFQIKSEDKAGNKTEKEITLNYSP